ncbi:DUF3040 domain-containing protein [Nocardioides sp. AE5]|uniref:DUF3040 domain-containing protein n=1 Tax=Nocardioides sp. AE5 TaxID=2962573 RepID=UPI002881B6F5|nr:DUF3040 domain-containing protein [Nocardioides sp. AE5]MDT0201243.1 DUF3040 domain-containing protein [Nocardioides sp. AE5]
MPLSEEELRLLEQMERALSEEDPKFASALRGTTSRQAARRKAVASGAVFIVGIALLMSGAIFAVIPLGIIGFIVMLAAATYGLAALRGGNAAPSAEARPSGRDGFGVIDGGRAHRTRKPRSSTPFMERMEERWRRRRDDGGF